MNEKVYILLIFLKQTNPGLVRLVATDLCLDVGGLETQRGAGAWARRDLGLNLGGSYWNREKGRQMA